MDFQTASHLCSLIAKDYSEAFFRLLVTHQNLSASEAASRLNLHIKTAQDFLEGLHQHDIVNKEEVNEGKRPYFRFSLIEEKLSIDVDVSSLYNKDEEQEKRQWRIREKVDSGAIFKTSGKSNTISAVHFFTGEGRNRGERRIGLTAQQGGFLFHLPFPTEDYMSIEDIMKKSKVPSDSISEILNILELLQKHQILERETNR